MTMTRGKLKKPLLIALFLLSPTPRLLAAQSHMEEISWMFLLIGLFGGLSLFLYGIEKMSDGMKKAAGDKMRAILSALTKNRVIGFLVGAFVTMKRGDKKKRGKLRKLAAQFCLIGSNFV